MKITHFLITALLLLNAACNSDDDNNPVDPVDELPPATQVGAQTFGCLINGEPFLPPKLGSNRASAFYQFVDGAYTFIFTASARKDNGGQLQTVSVGGIDVDAILPKTYELKDRISKNHSAFYLLNGGVDLEGNTSNENPGSLIITRFDDKNFIISGIFEFTVLDNDGNEIKITDGRFDLNYTN